MAAWRVPLSDLTFGAEEKQAVIDVLDSGWLAMGEIAQSFESEFATLLGVKHALVVTNGTASLHLAAAALGIGPGDEVIVPSLTFVATANAILYTGAKPVFADVTSQTDLTISPQAIAEKITDRTRAIMVMHYGGYACAMPEIMALAKDHNLHVIEDAAHAPGGSLDGVSLGAWGDVGSFSFFPNKNMTTGEGGMLVTNDDDLAHKMRLLRSHGMTTLTWDRHRGHAWSYDVVDLGYNYRMDEIRAALGRVQLDRLEENNALRQAATRQYHRLLKEYTPDVEIPFSSHPGVATCHILPVLLPPGTDRARFTQAMKDRGVQTSLHYPPIHTFSYYRENGLAPEQGLPITEQAAAREVTLPLYPSLDIQDVEYVVTSVRDALIESRDKTQSYRAAQPT
jgi:dTDP-4-amino-4,6-dideoxygalactose transaminase